MQTQPGNGGPTSSIGEVVRRIGDDVKTIATDELALAKLELTRGFKVALGNAAAVLLGGIVALIGFGMLCVTAVIALAPVIPALWVRMIMMAAIYLLVGSVVAGVFARKLKADADPTESDAVEQAEATVGNIARGLTQESSHAK